jgi:hypothetical protein
MVIEGMQTAAPGEAKMAHIHAVFQAARRVHPAHWHCSQLTEI